MSLHYSANQYQRPFTSYCLQQYQVPRAFPEFPRSRAGSTRVIGDDRGHLLPGVLRRPGCPWGGFLGTWDLPKRIGSNHAYNHCARSAEAQNRLAREKEVLEAKLNGRKLTPRLQKLRAPSAPPAPLFVPKPDAAILKEPLSGEPLVKPVSPISPEPKAKESPRLPSPLEKPQQPCTGKEGPIDKEEVGEIIHVW